MLSEAQILHGRTLLDFNVEPAIREATKAVISLEGAEMRASLIREDFIAIGARNRGQEDVGALLQEVERIGEFCLRESPYAGCIWRHSTTLFSHSLR